jgi:hypothetical protein
MTTVAAPAATLPVDSSPAPPEGSAAQATREVRHEYTRNLPPILRQLGASLVVSTYQAGKVVGVGVDQGELTLSYHNFERAMGLAIKPGCLAVGARAQIWFLCSAPAASQRVGAVTVKGKKGQADCEKITAFFNDKPPEQHFTVRQIRAETGVTNHTTISNHPEFRRRLGEAGKRKEMRNAHRGVRTQQWPEGLEEAVGAEDTASKQVDDRDCIWDEEP